VLVSIFWQTAMPYKSFPHIQLVGAKTLPCKWTSPSPKKLTSLILLNLDGKLKSFLLSSPLGHKGWQLHGYMSLIIFFKVQVGGNRPIIITSYIYKIHYYQKSWVLSSITLLCFTVVINNSFAAHSLMRQVCSNPFWMPYHLFCAAPLWVLYSFGLGSQKKVHWDAFCLIIYTDSDSWWLYIMFIL